MGFGLFLLLSLGIMVADVVTSPEFKEKVKKLDE
jgi:hypothetical protein